MLDRAGQRIPLFQQKNKQNSNNPGKFAPKMFRMIFNMSV